MRITLENLSKRFNREQIFKNLSCTFDSNKCYAITGPNGSGKSTLLQIIAGSTLPSSGNITYSHDNANIHVDDIYKHMVIVAPYLEIIEEYTLREQLEFHFKYKTLKKGSTIESILKEAYFEEEAHKFIKNFSSGMKQRLKLALAFYSDTHILLLDEPTSNLDKNGINWYHDQLKKIKNRLIIIASNQENEYITSDIVLNIADFK